MTDRQKHIAQIVVMLAFSASLIAGIAINNRIVSLKNEVTIWQERCIDWRDTAWYWESAYNELLSKRAFESRDAKARIILLEAEQIWAEAQWVDVGECRITHYCPCEICCGKWADGITATGTVAEEGRTVAVDPDVIPLGSEVLIDGKIYIAEDTGVKGNAVDIFLTDHNRCFEYSVYMADVKWRQADTHAGIINT